MPPLNQHLPQTVVEALRNARIYSTIDLLSAELGTLLRVFEAEDVRKSLLQFLIKGESPEDSTLNFVGSHENSSTKNGNEKKTAPFIVDSDFADPPSPTSLINLLKKYVVASCTKPGRKANCILNNQNMSNGVLKCGLKNIDANLGGGMPPGTVTEINGRAGSGKTYFCLLTAAKALYDDPSANVCFVDTKHSFSPERFNGICKDLLRKQSLDNETSSATCMSMLKRLLYFQAFDIYAVFDLLNSIKKKFESRLALDAKSRLTVLILDSVTSIGRPLIGSGYGGHALIMHLAQMIKDIAVKLGIVVLITNATVSDQRNSNNGKSEVKAALGKVWQFVPHKRVHMTGV